MQAEKEPEGPQKAEFVEPRPTCVTVIGWAWIIIGGLLCLSGIMAIFYPITMELTSETHFIAPQNVAGVLVLLGLLAVVLMGIGVLGLVSGVSFLKMTPWSRRVLEILTWLALVYVAVLGTIGVYTMMSEAGRESAPGLRIMAAFWVALVIGLYVVPLVIMLRYLRGRKVRNALSALAQGEALGQAPAGRQE